MATIQTTDVFERWFEKLRDREAKARINVRIRRLSMGNPGDHRNLTKGVSELRINHGPGYRIYYVTCAGITYLLLCGGDKDSQEQDIAQALAMVDEL